MNLGWTPLLDYLFPFRIIFFEEIVLDERQMMANQKILIID